MFTQEITVSYADGRQDRVMTTQADVAAWEMYAVKRGLKPSGPGRSLMEDMPVTFLRYCAWSAVHRPGTGPRPDFDVWGADVLEVSVESAETVDPTPMDTPGD